MKSLYISIFFSFALFARGMAGDTIYVNSKATGLANGTSWQNAYKQAHQAIMQAHSGDQIWVAKGRYALANSQVIPTLYFPSGVQMYGNFTGGETSVSDRIMDTIETVFDRNFDTTQIFTQAYLGCLRAAGTDSTTLIDGIRFVTGDYSSIYNWDTGLSECAFDYCEGGALLVYSDSIHPETFFKVNNCLFDSCVQSVGSAISVNGMKGNRVHIEVTNCKFRNNQVDAKGGAFNLSGESSNACELLMNRCQFSGNKAKIGPPGLYIRTPSSECKIKIDSCLFDNNKGADFFGGGTVYIVCINDSNLVVGTIKNCKFINNYAGSVGNGNVGGALLSYNLNIDGCVFKNNYAPISGTVRCGGNTNITNCVFDGNRSQTHGSAITSISDAKLNISNSVFINQVSETNDGLIRLSYYPNDRTKFHIRNCIFWNNKQNGSSDNLFKLVFPDTFSINHCLFDYPDSAMLRSNGIYSINSNDPAFPNSNIIQIGAGNIFGKDPLFFDTLSMNYRLLGCSPAINAGDPVSAQSLGISQDLYGLNRFLDGYPDIGAAETSPVSINHFLEPSLCGEQNGGSINTLISGGQPPFSVAWSNGGTGSMLSNLSDGQYNVVIQEGARCTYTDTVTLQSPDTLLLIPLVQNAHAPQSPTGSIHLTTLGGTAPYMYAWSNEDTDTTLLGLIPGIYTVTVTDQNGCTSVSAIEVGYTVSLPDVFGDSHGPMHVFPNPVRQKLSLDIDESLITSAYKMSVINAKGQTLIESNFTSELDLGTISSGLYFLIVRNKRNQIIAYARFNKME